MTRLPRVTAVVSVRVDVCVTTVGGVEHAASSNSVPEVSATRTIQALVFMMFLTGCARAKLLSRDVQSTARHSPKAGFRCCEESLVLLRDLIAIAGTHGCPGRERGKWGLP